MGSAQNDNTVSGPVCQRQGKSLPSENFGISDILMPLMAIKTFSSVEKVEI